jgi:hypothetical protein
MGNLPRWRRLPQLQTLARALAFSESELGFLPFNLDAQRRRPLE